MARWVWQEACANTHGHTGDLIMPSTINLFRRALKEKPSAPTSALDLPRLPIPSLSLVRQRISWPEFGKLGEEELPAAVAARFHCAKANATDTGDDLNLIVKLLMARAVKGTETHRSEEAAKLYASLRPLSYGSFFDAYIAEHGENWKDLEERMRHGIDKEGWKPTLQPHVGAVRWYHRPSQGANPRLADLYQPILEWAFPGPVDNGVGVGGTSEPKECRVRGDKD
ncbi:MAG: hypothetical protein MPN21_24265 [Thermoanaerobaculia bacterium]|nr:hypothetical protein [Thermoanaerobaculia bacterium]